MATSSANRPGGVSSASASSLRTRSATPGTSRVQQHHNHPLGFAGSPDGAAPALLLHCLLDLFTTDVERVAAVVTFRVAQGAVGGLREVQR